MEFVFQKAFRIYFVMDFIRYLPLLTFNSGGELYKHLAEARRFPEERAKFYAA